MAAVTLADHGTLTVTTQSNDLAHSWRNSMDVQWDHTAGPPAYADAVIGAFVSFLKGIQRDDCTIIHAALRNWSRGDVAFADQAAIWEQVLAIPCKNYGSGTAHPTVSVPLTPVPGEICLLMAKPIYIGGGRPGHMFLRNSVGQETVVASAGGPPRLDPSFAAAFTTEINTWASTNLVSFVTLTDLPRFCLVHYSKKEGTVFSSTMRLPILQRLAMHDISSGTR